MPLIDFVTDVAFGVDFEVTPVVVADFETRLSFGVEWSVSAIATVDAAFGIRFGVRFSATATGDDGTEVWVLNVKTGQSTRYTHYPFNSYARIGTDYYGVAPTGLYRLQGDTDAGEPITASIDFGRLDMGTSTKVTVEQGYVGMSGGDKMKLYIQAEGQAYDYDTRSYSEHMETQRVTLGKGLRTSYVDLQLTNNNGAAFELDKVEFVVSDMTRRI